MRNKSKLRTVRQPAVLTSDDPRPGRLQGGGSPADGASAGFGPPRLFEPHGPTPSLTGTRGDAGDAMTPLKVTLSDGTQITFFELAGIVARPNG